MKPAEKYPKDQLALIQLKLDELAKKSEEERKAKELEEQYKALIATADEAFGAEKWDDAVTKYTEASTLRPAERYPKDQLAAIQWPADGKLLGVVPRATLLTALATPRKEDSNA